MLLEVKLPSYKTRTAKPESTEGEDAENNESILDRGGLHCV
jgi:hypothetical protein